MPASKQQRKTTPKGEQQQSSLRPSGRRGEKRKHNTRAYKSGFEEKFHDKVKEMGYDLPYEKDKIKYTIPESLHTYTPDFTVTKNVFIETKGQWTTQDRKKALFIKEQHPEITILYVLYRNQKLSKKSTTTYLDWALKHDIPCCLYSEVPSWKTFIEIKRNNNATT